MTMLCPHCQMETVKTEHGSCFLCAHWIEPPGDATPMTDRELLKWRQTERANTLRYRYAKNDHP